MQPEKLDDIMNALNQKEEAIDFIAQRMVSDVERLEKLGVAKADIAKRIGLVARVGRPKRASAKEKPAAA